jgi:2-methylcitrate dehydratase PrpD
LWEPLSTKHRPPTSYAAKFSTPFCMAVGFIDRKAGFAQFTEPRVQDRAVLEMASKIRYRINPDDEYPGSFTGHLRAVLRDGSEREFRQPHMRGGAHAPLPAAELEAKFMDNTRYGGWSETTARRLLRLAGHLFTLPRMESLAEFRS